MTKERVLGGAERAKRPARTPVSGSRDILTIQNKDPAFHYHIVKDKPGRIDKFLAASYEIVTHEVKVGDARVGIPGQEGSPVKVSMGRGEHGYLMRLPNDLYEEDQTAKQDEIKAQEEQMISNAKSKDGTYGQLEVGRLQRGGS